MDQIGKPPIRLSRKMAKTQRTNIRNERGAITNDPMDIKLIIKECYEKCSAHKLGNLDEMSWFLGGHQLLNQCDEK